jgi:hypothetical protein
MMPGFFFGDWSTVSSINPQEFATMEHLRGREMLICLIVSLLGCTENNSEVDVEWDDGTEEGSENQNDHFYAGGWPVDSCRNDLQPTGMSEGDFIDDIKLLDQYGEDIRLHDFCNHTILLEHAGFGDGGSTGRAPELEALYQQYKNDGLIVVTAMVGGSAVDLQAWADTYGLTAPVTMDTAGLASSFDVSFIPADHLIARGGVIYSLNTHASATLIEEALAFTP